MGHVLMENSNGLAAVIPSWWTFKKIFDPNLNNYVIAVDTAEATTAVVDG